MTGIFERLRQLRAEDPHGRRSTDELYEQAETKPIHIDLRDLTDERVAQVKGRGKCSYLSPCSLGTLMTPEERERAHRHSQYGSASIGYLVETGVVTMPPGQLPLAERLQRAFDNPRADFPAVLAEVRAELKELRQ